MHCVFEHSRWVAHYVESYTERSLGVSTDYTLAFKGKTVRHGTEIAVFLMLTFKLMYRTENVLQLSIIFLLVNKNTLILNLSIFVIFPILLFVQQELFIYCFFLVKILKKPLFQSIIDWVDYMVWVYWPNTIKKSTHQTWYT